MTFPRTIRYSTLARIVFSAVFVSLIVIVFSLVTMDSVLTMYQEMKASRHRSEPLLWEETMKRLGLENKILESELKNEWQVNDGGEKSFFLGANDYIKHLKQENDNLVKKFKTCQAVQLQEEIVPSTQNKQEEKNVLVEANNNLMMSREFFNYMAPNLRKTLYPGVKIYTQYAVARLGLSPLIGVEPLIPEFGPVINDVLSFQYPISIPPCKITNLSSVNRTVFVAIFSASGNFKKRKMIRQTWLNHLNDVDREGLLATAGLAFILSLTENNEMQTKIVEESKTYGDIIQIGISDYDDLSLKLTGLSNWMFRNCLRVDFILKVNDDVYVNARNLAYLVKSYHKSNLSMFGLSSPHPNFWPQRDGERGIPFEDWPWEDYPPFLNETVILFPGSMILPLLAAFQTTPKMRFNDVYYTGICTEKAGIKIHLYAVNSTVDSVAKPSVTAPCDLHRFVAWVVNSENEIEKQMNNSHIATDNFYRNVTQCIIANSKSAINPSDPVQFYFTELSQNKYMNFN